jgi:hypothetical protein
MGLVDIVPIRCLVPVRRRHPIEDMLGESHDGITERVAEASGQIGLEPQGFQRRGHPRPRRLHLGADLC